MYWVFISLSVGRPVSRIIPSKCILVFPTPFLSYLGVQDIGGELVPPAVMGLLMVLNVSLVGAMSVGIDLDGLDRGEMVAVLS